MRRTQIEGVPERKREKKEKKGGEWWQERGLGYGQTNKDTNKELGKGIQRGKGQRMCGRNGMDGRNGRERPPRDRVENE